MNKEKTNKNIQNFINWCLKYGTIIISIIILIIGISSIFVTAYFNSNFHHAEEKTSFKYSLGIIPILISIITIGLILFINRKILKKIPSKYIMIAISIFSLLLYIFWINALQLCPENDQKLIHEMALHALDGDVSFYTSVSQYLFLYPYQFFFTFIVTIIYKIFGTNYLYIEYLNAICSVINGLLLFFISKQIFKDEKIQKLLTIFIGGFTLYWMFFNVHFYGNILGLTLALLAILFTTLYLNTHKLRYTFFIGLFIALASLVKTNYQVFLIAIVICLIIDIIKNYNHKKLLSILLFLIGFISINLAYKPILNYYNIDTTQGVPMSNFLYMGMAEPTDLSCGWYTGDNVEVYKKASFNKEKDQELVNKLISDRLTYFTKNPKEFFSYYTEKISSTWLNPTFQTIWCSLPGTRYIWYPEYAHYLGYHEKILSMVGGNLYKIEEFYFDIYQIITFIFASIGIYLIANKCNKKDESNTNSINYYLLPITFIGGFLFHILWETKAIYVIQYYFLLLPFTSYGLLKSFDFLLDKFKQKKHKKNETNQKLISSNN